ncbi:MAG: DUF1120 domain-containing protein [Enterobacteriaceae bacterium]
MRLSNHLLLFISLLTTFSALASDSPSTTLKITGRIMPTACAITLDNEGVVRFGKQVTRTLSANEINPLGSKEIRLHIKCGAPTLVAWTAMDEQHNSITSVAPAGQTSDSRQQSSETQYGLGTTTQGVNLGSYQLTTQASRVTANIGNLSVLAKSDQESGDWTLVADNSTITIDSQGNKMITLGKASSRQPVAYSEAIFPLTVTAALQAGRALNLTDEATLDGATTICLIYL